MVRDVSLLVLGAFSLLLPITFLIEHVVAEWSFALMTTVFPVALIGLGAGRAEGWRALRPWVFALGLVLTGGALSVLALAGDRSPSVGGLPVATAILIYGLGVLPLGIVSVAYVRCFHSSGLRARDLDRVRRLRRKSLTSS
jgi:hypothetical protein